MKGKIAIAFRVVISVGLLAFLLWSVRGQLNRIGDTLAKTSIPLFVLAASLFLVDVILISLRLRLLFDGEKLRIAFGRIIQLSFIGYFFNNFMPTAVGGDIVKAYYAHKQTKQTAKSFIAVFMDRFLGLFSFVLIAVIALAISWGNTDILLKKIVLAFAVFGMAGFTLIMNERIAKIILKALSGFKIWRIGERLSKVYMAVHEYKNKKGLILKAIGISLIAQGVYFSIVYLLAKSIGANPVFTAVFLIMPVVSVISMLPSLGGLGLREGAMVILFGPMIGRDNAFSLSILLLATLLIVSIVGGIIYIFASQFRMKEAEISKMEKYSV